jgi:integrase
MTLQEAVLAVSGEQQQNILYLRSLVAAEFPDISKALKLIDADYQTKKQPQGFSLLKVSSKKQGFIYYVRYYHEGKIIPSKWCTHTNDKNGAHEFARKNREPLISGYYSRNSREVERFFNDFYDPNSQTYKSESQRADITEKKRKDYESILRKKFVPFLRKLNIKTFDEITTPVLDNYQDSQLNEGLKAQSINDQMAVVKKVFGYLARKGINKNNPCSSLQPIPEKAEDKKTHGCYELEKLKGIFNKDWEDKKSYLLNLLIYSTGMRNCEITRFCKNDIVNINGCRFIDIKKSKTENGIRRAPLHEKAYQELMDYAKDTGDAKPIFKGTTTYQFTRAYQMLGEKMRADGEFLKTKNITFYSGRHAWKTMMSAGGLGEGAEEVFMGHKVSANVAKLYNHNDMKGKALMAEKARKIFTILDKKLFCKQPAGGDGSRKAAGHGASKPQKAGSRRSGR